jgi:hypothetical protein
LKPQRQTPPLKAARSYFRKPGPYDPAWLAQVLQTVDFLREQELRRKQNERQLYILKRASRLKSIGPQGSSTTSRDKQREARDLYIKSLIDEARHGSELARTRLWLIGRSVTGEKRSGVMTGEVVPIMGARTVTTTVGTGVNSIHQPILAWQKILSLVQSVDGDHVRPNPHHFRVRRIDYGGGMSYAGDSTNNTVISGNQALPLGLTGSFTDQSTFVYNKALNQLYQNIRGDVDLSVDAFQARQTGVMLNQRFKQARELFVRKAPFALMEMVKIVNRMKRSNPRDWGSLWLEWTYGWKPLAGSIFGAADQMVKVATSPSVRSLPVRAAASEKGDSKTVVTPTGTQGVFRSVTTESVYQSRITSYFAMQNSRLNAVAGLTSLNPVSIAWELVPYSFVADWFVDIGGYLRNMESSLLYNSQFTGGYTTNRFKQRVVESVTGGNASYSVGVSGSSETRDFTRSPQASAPIPRPPTFNPNLGTSRLISAAALLSQQLHSFKR